MSDVAPSTTHYRIDATASRFTVQAFATGVLSFLGHSPVFAAHDLGGELAFDDDRIANLKVDLLVKADSLEVLGDFSASDRQQIVERMWDEVLYVARHPEVIFHGEAVASERLDAGRYRIVVEGPLTLRGVTRPVRAECELLAFSDGFRLRGETRLRMSDHGIPPVTALGGTIRLRDEVRLAFDLAALVNPSE